MSKKKQGSYPRAVVREIDGKLVLDDPDALAVIQAVGKHNCRITLEQNADRVTHFKRRLAEHGLAPSDAVIVLMNVTDVAVVVIDHGVAEVFAA